METAIYNEYQIVKVIKRRAKTSIVIDLTSYSDKEIIVKNNQLKEDPFTPLNEETAKTAKMIIRINQPQYGIQKFNYKSQDLGNNEYAHTFGQGCNSGLITDLKQWRVIR